MSDEPPGPAHGERAAKARPVAVGPPRRRMSRAERAREERRRRQRARRRRLVGGLGVALVTMVLIAAVFLGSKLWHARGPITDYTGEGGQQVLIEVHEGDF